MSSYQNALSFGKLAVHLLVVEIDTYYHMTATSTSAYTLVERPHNTVLWIHWSNTWHLIAIMPIGKLLMPQFYMVG